MISDIDFALRASTVTLLLVLCVLLLRDYRRSAAGRLASALALGAVAYTLVSASPLAINPPWLRALLVAVSSANVVVLWAFTQSVFDDAFVPRRRHAVAGLAIAGWSLVVCLGAAPPPLHQILSAGLDGTALAVLALAVARTVKSWRDDLVERRRQLRIFIVIAAAGHGGVQIVLRLWLDGGSLPRSAGLLSTATLTAIVATIAWALLRTSGDSLFANDTRQPAPPLEPPAADAALDAPERLLVQRLSSLMAQERLYRQEGLSIGSLALRLGIQEYKLRRLINQELGYRNFNAFLNSYRIDEVKAALADPGQAEVPITTIALDAGFQSLGPFNRAFKSLTGLTPTEFKRMNNAAPSL